MWRTLLILLLLLFVGWVYPARVADFTNIIIVAVCRTGLYYDCSCLQDGSIQPVWRTLLILLLLLFAGRVYPARVGDFTNIIIVAVCWTGLYYDCSCLQDGSIQPVWRTLLILLLFLFAGRVYPARVADFTNIIIVAVCRTGLSSPCRGLY